MSPDTSGRPQRLWEFGGHPYGLEPLVLPYWWQPPSVQDPPPEEEPLQPPPDGALAGLRAEDPTTVDRLFWFRWIVGHQVTFILWQLLAAVLDEKASGRQDRASRAEQATLLVRGYSLMLLYSATPPRRIYNPVIRSVMARQHIHLSGAWARDFGPVRGVFRGRVPLDDRALLDECAVNHRIHESIVDKLTPGAPSLLQMAADHHGRQWRSDMVLALYDCIFITLRSPISHGEVVRQLLSRLRCVDLDVKANSLYPNAASSLDEEPPEMKASDIVERKNQFTETLQQIAELAVRSCL